MCQLGLAQEFLDQAEKALESYSSALRLYRFGIERSNEIETLYLLARLQHRSGQLTEARSNIEEALNVVESLRTQVTSPRQRMTYLGTAHNLYSLHAATLMRLHERQPSKGFDLLALQASERARARTLLESLVEAHSNWQQSLSPTLLAQKQMLRQKLKAKAAAHNRLLADNDRQGQLELLAKEIASLTSEYELLESRLRTDNPRYAALTQPQPLGVAEIQKEVVTDKDALLLEYALGEEQSFLWTISAGSFNTYELPKGKVIEQASQRVYDLLTARNQSPKFETPEERAARIKKADAEFPAAAAELSRMILAPIAAELRARRPKQLLIVADGKLQYVPFAALPMPTTEGQRDRGTERKRASRSIPPSLRPSVSPSLCLSISQSLRPAHRQLRDRQFAVGFDVGSIAARIERPNACGENGGGLCRSGVRGRR